LDCFLCRRDGRNHQSERATNVLPAINCSGLVTSTFVTGFYGYRCVGEVYATETCARFYKGTRVGSRQIQSWTSVLWDFSGNATSLAYDGQVPNTAFTAADANGDFISDLVSVRQWRASVAGASVREFGTLDVSPCAARKCAYGQLQGLSAIRLAAQHRRAADAPGAQIVQGPVGIRQGIAHRRHAEVRPRGDLEELARVAPREVRDRSQYRSPQRSVGKAGMSLI